MIRIGRISLVITSVLVAIAVAATPILVSAQATPTPSTGEQYTPLLQSVHSPPRWFSGADGKVHLVYELLLTNAFPVPVTVTSVDVLNAENESTIESLEGESLSASMSLLT